MAAWPTPGRAASSTVGIVCGIGGFVCAAGVAFDRTRAARVLLAGVAERGRDATGVAWRAPGGPVAIAKDDRPFAEVLERVAVDDDATQAMVHIRDFTKGVPTIAQNNHPIRHGHVTGVHNGRIRNDDALFAADGAARAHPAMTVDSEAIFMVLEGAGAPGPTAPPGRVPAALERLEGSMAAAWFDDRDPGAVRIARGVLRPLFVGIGDGIAAWSSNSDGLRFLERIVGARLAVRPVVPGEILELRDGRIARRERFRPDFDLRETNAILYERSDDERSLLSRLTA